MNTAGTTWGETALAVAEAVLASEPGLNGSSHGGAVVLHSLRARAQDETLDVRLDKPSDKGGSPDMASGGSVIAATLAATNAVHWPRPRLSDPPSSSSPPRLS